MQKPEEPEKPKAPKWRDLPALMESLERKGQILDKRLEDEKARLKQIADRN